MELAAATPARAAGAILRYNGAEKELFGGAAQTTNNRMELTGVISALGTQGELRCGAVLGFKICH